MEWRKERSINKEGEISDGFYTRHGGMVAFKEFSKCALKEREREKEQTIKRSSFAYQVVCCLNARVIKLLCWNRETLCWEMGNEGNNYFKNIKIK